MDADDDVPSMSPIKGKISILQACCTCFHLLLLDVIVYGCLIPLIGTYVGGSLAHKWGFPPKCELLVVVILTFTLMYIIFCLIGETTYWKRMFEFDGFYGILLQIRDAVNGVIFVCCLSGLMSTIETMIVEDKELKSDNLSEGMLQYILKIICDWFSLCESSWVYQMGLLPPRAPAKELSKLEHGASFMLFWAMLAACVAKLVYFNTMFTYLRAMEIFLGLNPVFIGTPSLRDADSQTTTSSFRSAETGKADSTSPSHHQSHRTQRNAPPPPPHPSVNTSKGPDNEFPFAHVSPLGSTKSKRRSAQNSEYTNSVGP